MNDVLILPEEQSTDLVVAKLNNDPYFITLNNTWLSMSWFPTPERVMQECKDTSDWLPSIDLSYHDGGKRFSAPYISLSKGLGTYHHNGTAGLMWSVMNGERPLVYKGKYRLKYFVKTKDDAIPLEDWKVAYIQRMAVDNVLETYARKAGDGYMRLDKLNRTIVFRNPATKRSLGGYAYNSLGSFIEFYDPATEDYITYLPAGTMLWYNDMDGISVRLLSTIY